MLVKLTPDVTLSPFFNPIFYFVFWFRFFSHSFLLLLFLTYYSQAKWQTSVPDRCVNFDRKSGREHYIFLFPLFSNFSPTTPPSSLLFPIRTLFLSFFFLPTFFHLFLVLNISLMSPIDQSLCFSDKPWDKLNYITTFLSDIRKQINVYRWLNNFVPLPCVYPRFKIAFYLSSPYEFDLTKSKLKKPNVVDKSHDY